MNEDNDQPPKSEAVGNSWREFEKTLRPELAGDESPALTKFAQVSFYFGVLGALELVDSILEGAASEEAVGVALDGLRDEVEEFLESQSTITH